MSGCRISVLSGVVCVAAMLAGSAEAAPRGVGGCVPTPVADSETGARPGNDIGTGMSLPLGDTASNLNAATVRSSIAPNLPTPPVGDDATPHDYLVAARAALAAGRTGEAQQALEMAETRALDRSTPLRATDRPSGSKLVGQIHRALQSLPAGRQDRTLALIDAALPLAASPDYAAK